MAETNQQFEIIYDPDHVFKIGIRDLLGAPVETIVNPANSGLSHGGGLAAVISDEAGPELDNACKKIIQKYGQIPETIAVPTEAGNLPFKGIIHAVGPRMGNGKEKFKIQETVIHSLQVAQRRGWKSIAFPAISTGLFGVPPKLCAHAFKEAIPTFWKENKQTCINLIWLCLTVGDFPIFKTVIQSGPES